MSRTRWDQLDGLRTDRLDAVFSYYDAQTDDARLTRSVLASARELGADVITAAEFTRADLASDKVSVNYVNNGSTKAVVARALVNAAGPWINQVQAKIYQSSGERVATYDMELVQGTHIVVAGEIAHPYYLEAPQDGRAVFVLPWKNNIMVGTTESHYQGDPARVRPLAAEIDYLLEIYNYYFNRSLERDEVVESFAGLRVLPGGRGDAFNKSRDSHFLQDNARQPRLVSIYGGKLTSYRAASDSVLASLRKTLPAATRLARTCKLGLPVID